MAKWIRNQYDKALTYENILKAHILSKRGKSLRKEIILFSLNTEENIQLIYEQLKNGTYKHGAYTEFKVYEPKERTIEKATYRDRIVHRWVVDNFLVPYYMQSFIKTSYACIKGRGMHKATLDLQAGMKAMQKSYRDYYILKMDVTKYFNNIDKKILFEILQKRIKDKKLLWLIKNILLAQKKIKGLEIRKLYLTNICKYLFK